MTTHVDQLLQTFQEWERFCGELQGSSEEIWSSSLQPGKWTVKDIVCHMMRWDQYFYREAIAKIVTGEPITMRHLNFDEFNQKSMEYARTISNEDVVQEAIQSREDIIAAIKSMPVDIQMKTYTDADGNPFSVPQYLQDFIWHDRHHMVPLQRYLNERQLH